MTAENILIYDIETAAEGKRPDASKDVFRCFGCYSYITGEYYFLTDLDKVKRTVKAHSHLVGFNNFAYDNVVLKRFLSGFQFREGYDQKFNAKLAFFKRKFNIDLMRAFEKRAKIIKVGEKVLDDVLLRFNLDSIAKAVGASVNGGKFKDFDYGLLRKESWTDEERQLIREYTLRDVELTKSLYDFLADYFDGFKEYLNDYSVASKAYMTCSPSAFAYKAVCNELGMEEEYLDDEKREDLEVSLDEPYEGGYVAHPGGESFDETKGEIYLLDFNSLYPHINIQCNLFSPANQGWNGNGKFKTSSAYDDKAQGVIEKFLQDVYTKRKGYKKLKDPRELALKIVLNATYGISSSKRFVNVYRPNTAPDCTALGRQWIQLARKRFRAAGYTNIFSDTDSACILDPYRDKQRLLKVKDAIIQEIKANVPFPSDTFDMSIDAEISNIWFFKGKQEKSEEEANMDEEDYLNARRGLLKKNYVYLTKQGELVIKNLGVRKKSISALTRHIFWNILVPKIKEERKVKFPKTFFKEIIQQLLSQDFSYATLRYSVSAAETYKKESQLQAQIAARYGPGVHFLIPNRKKIGVGKKKSYCSVEEYQQNKLTIDDIILDNVWAELDYFIEKPPILDLLGLEFLPNLLSYLFRMIESMASFIKPWIRGRT
jgi:DNA polymerase elongation subunit (family B)